MATKSVRFIPKRTSVSGRIPTGTTGEENGYIKQGELAVNTADKKLFSYDGSNIFEFGSNSYLALTGGTVTGNINTIGNISGYTYDINPVNNPTSLSGVTTSGLGLSAGSYVYLLTYTTAIGETNVQEVAINVAATGTSKQITLYVPTSNDARVTGRRLCRTLAGGQHYNNWILTSITNNTVTTYIDSVPDTSLSGGTVGNAYRPNTTSPYITIGGVRSMMLDQYQTIYGTSAGGNLSSGYGNSLFGSNPGAALTTGIGNSIFGWNCLAANTSGQYNAAIGYSTISSNRTGSLNTAVGAYSQFNAGANSNTGNNSLGFSSLYNVSTGNYNTAIGYQAGYTTTNGAQSVFLGFQAGYYETAGSKLFIDNTSRASEADARTKALIYGVFSSTVAAQTLQLNGNVGIQTPPTSSLHTAGSFSAGYVEKNANYTLGVLDYTVNYTGSTGSTITLPTAVGIQGRIYNIQNTGAAIVTANTTSSQALGSGTTKTLSQWNSIQVQATGVKWIILSQI